MNSRKMFTSLSRRTFCSGTPFHHDYVPPQNITKGLLGVGLSTFDLCRIIFYVLIGMKVINHSFSFIAFRKTKFLNNPDYQLCDLKQYEQIRAEHAINSNK